MNKKLIKYILFFCLFIFIDVAFKFYAFHAIKKTMWFYSHFPFGGIGIFKNFLGFSLSLNLVKNMGAAWGLFAMYPKLLFYVRICIVLFLGGYLFWKKPKIIFPFMLILAGAFGNLIDTIIYGYVIDIIHFRFHSYSFPVFNLADVYIFLGIFSIFFQSFFRGKEWEKKTVASQ